MRLFIAIDFKEQEDYFKKIQRHIPEDLAVIKKVNTFHLTLKFLGDMEYPHLEKINQKLKNIQFKPFKIKTDEIGFFPSEGYIKVIWIGFTPTEPLIKLQKQVQDTLKEFHFRADFNFIPHLTLARVKFIKQKEKFLEKIKKIKIQPEEIIVDNFKLIESTLTKEGSIYKELDAFP